MQGGDFLSLEGTDTGLLLCHTNKIAMIHISKIFELAQTLKRFSITWVAEDGRKVYVPDAAFTSGGFYSKGRTMNIVCLASGEVRKVKIETIIELNGQEVFA